MAVDSVGGHVSTPGEGRGRWLAGSSVGAFLVRRTLAGVATLFVASILIFAAVKALPAGPEEVVLGKFATPELVQSIRSNLGLDQSLPTRYVDWLGNMLTGDLGESTTAAVQGNSIRVWDVIQKPLLNSLVLSGITILLLVPLCIALGALAAIRAGRSTDHAINTTALSVAAMPEFLIGTLLIAVFFTALDALPPTSQAPLRHPSQLVLPVLALLVVNLAYVTRMVRIAMIETLGQSYVGMARLNGYPESRVITRYALRNALAPAVQSIAQTIRYLIGGVIVVESVFVYPGIGTVLLQAVTGRDVQVIAVVAFILAAVSIVINIIADLVVMLLVPKLRTQA